MKILHISYFGRFGKVTGIVEAVMNLTQRQIELGNEVKVLIPFNHPYVDGKIVFFAYSYGFARKFIKTLRPDIVVFDGLYDKYQIRLSFYLKINKIPYVLVFHGGASVDNAKKNWLKKKIANHLLFNRFVRWAKKVIYLSENEKGKSIFKQQNSCDAIIPNGVSLPENLTPKTKKNKIRITFLSRLDWYGKGLDVLYEAIRKFSVLGYENKLEFYFYGPKESEDCEKLFEFGTMSVYGGYVTGIEKERAFREADIFILPSRSEGMPVAVLEALSFGVPCIVTLETNMAELVKKNQCGWIVNLTVDNICKSIENIISEFQEQRTQLFYNCITAAKPFDWNEIAKQSQIIYDEVVHKK